jgi:hypothetical protein
MNHATAPLMLTHKDSNLDRQNQNLQCYRYTMGQFEKEPCF